MDDNDEADSDDDRRAINGDRSVAAYDRPWPETGYRGDYGPEYFSDDGAVVDGGNRNYYSNDDDYDDDEDAASIDDVLVEDDDDYNDGNNSRSSTNSPLLVVDAPTLNRAIAYMERTGFRVVINRLLERTNYNYEQQRQQQQHQLLEGGRRHRHRRVSLTVRNDVELRWGRTKFTHVFRRFVDLLESPTPPEVPQYEVAMLTLQDFQFDDKRLYSPQDVQRLFQQTLRSLPALTSLGLVRCNTLLLRSGTSTLGLLAAATTPPPQLLRELDLADCVMDSAGVAHVASMVTRPGSKLRVLKVTPYHRGLEPNDCRVLCDSIPANSHLRVLHLKVKAVFPDILRGAIAHKSSTLRELVVEGSFAEDWGGAASLAFQLRTNTQLVCLRLLETQFAYERVVANVRELVRTYNVTLRTVSVKNVPYDERRRYGTHLTSCLPWNRRIRTIIRHVLEPNKYRITPTSRWPRVYGKVSRFPTVLYRLLRRGDVNALCDAVRSNLGDGPAQQRVASRGRKRRAPDADGRSTVA